MNRKLLLVQFLLKLCGAQLLFEESNKYNDISILKPISRSPGILESVVDTVLDIPYALARHLERIEFPKYFSSDVAVHKFLADFETANKREDANLQFAALVNKYGLEVERYEITTEDGYILLLMRIVGTGPPVFLMHGLLGSADDFIVAGPDSGLAYLLAEQGYDVWLGNARGNKYSRKHITLNPEHSSFWDFSWHEIGICDLPVMIDYVLLKRNCTSLKYVGFSQGTTVFFVMTSERPEYNRKVSIMFALSPVAFMTNARSPVLKILAPGTSILQGVSKVFGDFEFLPDSKLINLLKTIVCGTGTLPRIICSNIIFLVTGFDFDQLNIANLPIIFGHFPCGASTKQLVHYGQSVLSKDFRKFDYGILKNLEKYGSISPPRYTLSHVETPVFMFFSNSDWLAHPKDVASLSSKLKNVLNIFKVPFEKFNHIDFIMARDVRVLVYERLIETLKSKLY